MAATTTAPAAPQPTPYEPRGGARDLFLCRDPEVLISGAAGTGKSLAALQKLVMRSFLVPGMRSLILRQTAASLTSTTLQTLERQVIAEAMARREIEWFGGSARKPAAYMFKNGSEILVGGLDNPSKLLSAEYDSVFVDEANGISLTAFEVIGTRMRGKAPTYKQIMLATNPDSDKHWLHQRYQDGKLTLITSIHADNPYLVNADGTETAEGKPYLERLRNLTGVRRARYYEGRWAAAEGQVWDCWSDAVNLADALPAGHESWRQVWTVDFGFNNSFVWQRWLIDDDGRAWLTHEIARRQRLVEDHARDILELMKANGWRRPEAIVCDHDAEGRATLERHLKMTTVAARKDVGIGVQAVYNRIRVSGDGLPRLLVLHSALLRTDPLAKTDKRPRGLAAEVPGYVWSIERGSDGQPREVPLKVNDHSCDAARYLVMYLDGSAPPVVGNPAKGPSSEAAAGSPWSRPVGR
ncbi:terminase [Streptomyces phage Mischief19]|nr:terminase [Streptomyces phage Mischief19]